MQALLLVVCAWTLMGIGLGTSTISEAATFYVALTGNDNNPGTIDLPFRTIYRGSTALRSGDTLSIRGGIYLEALVNSFPSGTSWDTATKVTAFTGEQVVLKPGATESRVAYFSRGAAYIVVDGIILDGTNVGYDAVKIDLGSNHIRFQNCEIRNAKNQGALVVDSSFIEFVKCSIHDNGISDLTHGLYLNGADNLVDGCKIYNNGGWGVHAYGSAAYRVIVRNNTIYNNARAGGRGPGIGLYTGSGHKAYNNILWGNREGIGVGEGASFAKVHNNTIYKNTRSGILIDTLSNSAEILNNILYSNAGGIANQGVDSILLNNLADVDPRFMDAAGGDFRLRGGSPAIDAGTTSDIVFVDFGGTRRPQGSANDMGAFEVVGLPDTEPPAPPVILGVK